MPRYTEMGDGSFERVNKKARDSIEGGASGTRTFLDDILWEVGQTAEGYYQGKLPWEYHQIAYFSSGDLDYSESKKTLDELFKECSDLKRMAILWRFANCFEYGVFRDVWKALKGQDTQRAIDIAASKGQLLVAAEFFRRIPNSLDVGTALPEEFRAQLATASPSGDLCEAFVTQAMPRLQGQVEVDDRRVIQAVLVEKFPPWWLLTDATACHDAESMGRATGLVLESMEAAVAFEMAVVCEDPAQFANFLGMPFENRNELLEPFMERLRNPKFAAKVAADVFKRCEDFVAFSLPQPATPLMAVLHVNAAKAVARGIPDMFATLKDDPKFCESVGCGGWFCSDEKRISEFKSRLEAISEKATKLFKADDERALLQVERVAAKSRIEGFRTTIAQLSESRSNDCNAEDAARRKRKAAWQKREAEKAAEKELEDLGGDADVEPPAPRERVQNPALPFPEAEGVTEFQTEPTGPDDLFGDLGEAFATAGGRVNS